MRIEHSFEVSAPLERAWELLLDVERVIPCMPGAELTELVDDRTWKAKMEVKLGPMSLSFRNDVRLEEVDEGARRVRLTASGHEARGRGGAKATVVSTLEERDGGTRVDIATDLTLSGPVGQYGRGIVHDVSAQLVQRFAECLEAELASTPAGEPASASAASVDPATARPVPAVPVRAAPPPPPAQAPIGGASLVARALARSLARGLRAAAEQLERRAG